MKVSSGSTADMGKQMQTWFTGYASYEISWEELLRIKELHGGAAGELPIKHILSAQKNVPFFHFMIRYLVYSFQSVLFDLPAPSSKDLDKYVASVSEEIGYHRRKHEKADCLVEFVMQAFEKNGCVAPNSRQLYGDLTNDAMLWSARDLYQILFKKERVSLPDFFALAFGLNMPVEDVNLFLKKVFLRGALDLTNETEMLLFLALSLHRTNKRALFQQLCMKYNEAAGNDCIEPTGISTGYLKNSVEMFVRRMNNEPRPESALEDECGRFFSSYKAERRLLLPKNRSLTKQFWGLLTEFEKNNSKQITLYKKGLEADEIARGTMTIVAKDNLPVYIPKGTFFGKNEADIQPGASVCDPNICVTTEDFSIAPAKDGVETILKVRCRETGKGNIQKKQVFTCELAALKGVRITNASLFKLPGKSNKPVEGNLRFLCPAGTVIPKGTVFYTGEVSFESVMSVTVLRSGCVTVEATTPNTAFKRNSIRFLLSNFPTKENILFFHNGTLSVRNINHIDEEEQARNDISTYLYEYNLEYLSHFDKELEADEGILPSFNGMETAAGLAALLAGSPLLAVTLTRIRVRNREAENIAVVFPETTGCLSRNGEETDGVITRKRLLTAAFLAVGSRRYEVDLPAQEVLASAVADINEELREAGFHELYLPNPFDCLIAYLTICADPIEAYRTVFDLAKSYKTRTKEQKDGGNA